MSEREKTPKLSWFDRRIDTDAIRIAVGADVREFAVLWLVFALLDVFVLGRLTAQWTAGNFALAVVVWLVGAYIEMKKAPRNDHG